MSEVSPDAPSGPNMEYDASYFAIEEIARGREETAIGDHIRPAEDPDWRRLKEESIEFVKKCKHLRVYKFLLVAAMKLDGLPGLADALEVLRSQLERYWDTIHPQLDPDDDNDPTERINILDSLGQPPNPEDPTCVQRRLHEVYLCESPQLGRYSYHNYLVASGELTLPEDPDSPPVQMSTVEAAFEDTQLETLSHNAQAIARAVEQIRAIESFLTEKVSAGHGTDLSGLIKLLNAIAGIVTRALEKRGHAVPEGGVDGVDTANGSAPQAAPTAALSGEVRTRQDVLNAIDKIFKYYQTQEPSSPVPVILKRARRLVTMDFMEIIADLSPDAVAQIEVISGVDSAAQDE